MQLVFNFNSTALGQYDVHLGKRVVDFLLVLIELFSPGFTAETLPVNID